MDEEVSSCVSPPLQTGKWKLESSCSQIRYPSSKLYLMEDCETGMRKTAARGINKMRNITELTRTAFDGILQEW